MILYYVVTVFFLFFNFSEAELTVNIGGDVDMSTPRAKTTLHDFFKPKTAACSISISEAASYEDPRWSKMSDVEKGDYIWDVSVAIANLHGYSYSPRTMTCKAFMESTFQPQIKAETSTSCGLSQVTEETGWEDVILQAKYQTKLPGKKPITSLKQYQDLVASSMVFQLEIGMMTFERKRIDFVKQTGDLNIRPILEKYRGADQATSELYAEKIIRCANCMYKNGNIVSQECLNCTSNKHFAECEKYKYAQ